MINVTDKTQKVSYTRVVIYIDPDFKYSFSEADKLLMWIGNPRELQSNDPNEALDIPAWSFILKNESMVPQLKGVLTKVIFETNL